MRRAVEHLAHELSGMRTGRANPGLLENIPVEAYGAHQPLKACGAVTVRSPQLLVVSVFDAQVCCCLVRHPSTWCRVLTSHLAVQRRRWQAAQGPSGRITLTLAANLDPLPAALPHPCSWCRRWPRQYSTHPWSSTQA